MVLDADITLPGAAPGTDAQGDVPAHVLQFGTIGNIPGFGDKRCFYHQANDWNLWNETPFTGGQNALLQQSDIDGAANSLISTYPAPDPEQALSLMLRPNERLLEAPAPACQPKVTSDHAVGDTIGETLVTAASVCTGYRYDYDGTVQLATRLLTTSAATFPGPLFKRNGQMVITVSNTRLLDPERAIIQLTVVAQGTWGLRL
jgi:hypothetical protein